MAMTMGEEEIYLILFFCVCYPARLLTSLTSTTYAFGCVYIWLQPGELSPPSSSIVIIDFAVSVLCHQQNQRAFLLSPLPGHNWFHGKDVTQTDQIHQMERQYGPSFS